VGDVGGRRAGGVDLNDAGHYKYYSAVALLLLLSRRWRIELANWKAMQLNFESLGDVLIQKLENRGLLILGLKNYASRADVQLAFLLSLVN